MNEGGEGLLVAAAAADEKAVHGLSFAVRLHWKLIGQQQSGCRTQTD